VAEVRERGNAHLRRIVRRADASLGVTGSVKRGPQDPWRVAVWMDPEVMEGAVPSSSAVEQPADSCGIIDLCYWAGKGAGSGRPRPHTTVVDHCCVAAGACSAAASHALGNDKDPQASRSPNSRSVHSGHRSTYDNGLSRAAVNKDCTWQ